ncbi:MULTISPECIES: ester cyclase [Methanosarcina]|uniref:SnoaL-like domain-containing protein n=2 Tax=Methanosarcina barkeri TaxID=2208 RepID=A0A0E3R2Z9_METBA|nr:MULTISPECIES: nuclear transport factor 2 family protein [Methanosarcina]AKB57999.1 hypothetical protein MSBR2_1483 [Methanosarcina barkeri 227]OED10379.1 hypothetical protein A9239_07250 [Methanosarcina sp. A14]
MREIGLEGNMFTEENKAIVRRFFEKGPSKGNISAADELLSPDFAIHIPFLSSTGVEGINELITACRAALEHLNVTVEDMIAKDNAVTARFTDRSVPEVVSWDSRLQTS